MIKAGAAGYVSKASASENFVVAVSKVLRGGDISARNWRSGSRTSSGHFDEEPFDVLSDREYQIFLMIASGKTVTDIADELCLSVKTVSTHRAMFYKRRA